MKNPYGETVALLGSLESFDAKAFKGDAACSQHLCDVVLSLALVYNDLRDLIVAYMCLEPVIPPDRTAPSPAVGNLSGISVHLLRILAGMVHETLELIRKNRKVFDEVVFKEVVRKLHPDARDAWQSLLDAADDRHTSKPLTKMLLFARNKVAFHYDRKEIARGYGIAFVDDPTRVPYVSRGENMATTRFYFADAAANEFMQVAGDAKAAAEFMSARTDVLNQLNHALREIVVGFVECRKFAWRPAT